MYFPLEDREHFRDDKVVTRIPMVPGNGACPFGELVRNNRFFFSRGKDISGPALVLIKTGNLFGR